MHGTLRFILALLVALSHLGFFIVSNFNQGVFAVVFFYLLAGMVSHKLITTIFINQPLKYYKNRIKRIFPIYIFALSFALIIYMIGVSSPFLSTSPNLLDWISNISIIPLSYYMYSHQDTFTLLPPAWSLGVELQFYLVAPFILKSKKLFFFIFISSLFIFIFASIGKINTDYFGYRLIVGVIFMFMLGSVIQKARDKNSIAIKQLIVIYLILITLFTYIYFKNYIAMYNYETILSLIVAIPLLIFFNSPLPKKVDKYMGELSYPLFLLHFPALWIYQFYQPKQMNIIIILIITLLLSIIAINLGKLLKFVKI